MGTTCGTTESSQAHLPLTRQLVFSHCMLLFSIVRWCFSLCAGLFHCVLVFCIVCWSFSLANVFHHYEQKRFSQLKVQELSFSD